MNLRRTRKAVLLDEMEQVVPWAELLALLALHAPGARMGRPPFEIEAMVRIHFLQQCFGLCDEAMQETLLDVPLYREFAGFGSTPSAFPTGSAFGAFGHLLERNNFATQIFGTICGLLSSRGLLRKQGTAVDAAVIAVPGATKNKTGTRDPEMALRLAKAVGRLPESWLAMQDNYDLWIARQRVDLQDVEKLEFAAS